MADYISTLTGSQMDSALLDMAEHNSEAYAVGERNGIPVTSGDAAYHNNARYYAQIASSQIVGDASSAVRWDTDQSEALTDAQKAVARNNINAASDSDVVKITSQTLTSAEQEQARANIAAGGSNRNLLDNPWWGSGEVVNQRGNTSGNTDHLAYNIDRWQTSYGSVKGTWSLSADGLTISASDVAYNQQKIENYTKLNGKTVTASVMTSDGVVHSGTVTNLNWSSSTIAFTDGNLRCQLASGGIFRVTSLNGSSNTIRAVKLELGSVSTLANDAPPDYGEELAKCQRYFVRFAPTAYTALWGGISANTGLAIFNVITPVPMRAAPTVSVTNAFYFVEQLSSGPALRLGTAYTAYAPVGNIVRFGVNTNSTLTTNNICQAYTYAYTPIIDLSADL